VCVRDCRNQSGGNLGRGRGRFSTLVCPALKLEHRTDGTPDDFSRNLAYLDGSMSAETLRSGVWWTERAVGPSTASWVLLVLLVAGRHC